VVPVEIEATHPTWLELHDPLAALQVQLEAARVRYEWRGGQWVYEAQSWAVIEGNNRSIEREIEQRKRPN
jgi:hypothetical protein